MSYFPWLYGFFEYDFVVKIFYFLLYFLSKLLPYWQFYAVYVCFYVNLCAFFYDFFDFLLIFCFSMLNCGKNIFKIEFMFVFQNALFVFLVFCLFWGCFYYLTNLTIFYFFFINSLFDFLISSFPFLFLYFCLFDNFDDSFIFICMYYFPS